MKLLIFLTSTFLICGCASRIEKAEIPSTANPKDEIASLEQDINAGYKDHFNILANDDFNKSKSWLKEAKEDFGDNQDREEVLDDIRYGRAYLNRARKTSENRADKIENVLEARTAAIEAGAESFSDTNESLKDADTRVRREADNLNELSPKEFSDLQTEYLDIELAAVKNSNLERARTIIKSAKDENADDRAPKTLNKAEIAIKNAENQIEANRNMPQSYQDAVDSANEQAQLLADVMNVSKQAGDDVEEDTALKMVMQNRQIARLNSELDESATRARTLGQRLSDQSADFNRQSQRLQASTSALGLQRALDSARSKFTNREADVYQQDAKLLIRLKSMGFASGSADLPSKSFVTLNKVVTVAKELDPSEILIEGHTDSTGSAAFNMELSQKRAEAVANYLEHQGIDRELVRTKGYGFQRPIANNKTANGRMQNRRVDVIIIPVTDTTIKQQAKK